MNALVGSVATLPCAARRVRDKQHARRRAATVSARAANKEEEDVCQLEQQPKGVADFAGNVRRAAAAASAAAVIAGCLPLDARAEIPPELTRPDPIFTENFNVKFAGIEMDHKDLIGALVVGQTVGFIGSVVGGNEARNRKKEVETLNESLLRLNQEMRSQLVANKVGVFTPARVATTGAPGREEDPIVQKTIAALKQGKQLLKTEDAKLALKCFEEAIDLLTNNAGAFKEPWRASRKALRGVGSAKDRIGDYEGALAAMKEVLRLSEEHRDPPAFFFYVCAISEIYTEMNKLEDAAHYYDLHLASLDCEDTAAVVNAMFVGSLDADDVHAAAR